MSALDGFDAFYAAHVGRHRTWPARIGALVGDAIVVVSAVLALRPATRRMGLRMVGVGFAVQLAGHLPDGTAGAEVRALGRHPVLGALADVRMFVDLARRRLPPARAGGRSAG